MKYNRIIILLSFLLFALMFISSASAIDDNDISNNTLTIDSSDLTLESVNELELDENTGINNDLNQTQLSSQLDDNQVVSSPRTIVVHEVEEEHQEMGDMTIQPAIDGADDGDTIIIEGRSYTHCHIVVDKQLTIISNVGTKMSPCPSNSQGSGYFGDIYLSSYASGTVIDGFDITNDIKRAGSYGILIDGASDVVIRNCNFSNTGSSDALRIINAKNVLIENVTITNTENGINIVNSQNVTVRNSNFKSSKYGIKIADSTQTIITNNNIFGNGIAGIAYSGTGSYLTVSYNNITENYNGINLTSSDHVYILSNYIAFNQIDGVYVDNDIELIVIKGNFFNQNYYWEVYNDYHVTNLLDFGNEREIIDNNYMINYGYGEKDIDRPVWTQVFEYRPGLGDYDYDAANDRYVYVGPMQGDYDGHQGIMFIRYVFEINEFMHCPNTHIDVDTVWSKAGNYELQLSEITQVKKGVYSISIVNAQGEIATDISSVPVTFYLNKEGKTAAPQEDDTYKTVLMKNGTATVRFTMEDFNVTGNVITAVFPTPGTNFDSKVSKTFAVDDEDIPGIPSNTSISVSNLNTYPKSNQELIATLTDVAGKALVGQVITIKINGKTYNDTTDGNGQVKIRIYEVNEGTYNLSVAFIGDDADYYSSSNSSAVVVKKTASKIVSSNVYMIPKMAEYYSITLKDASNKPISGKKVTFNVNGQKYVRTTNTQGIAKVALKFTIEKTYKITVSFAGDNQYKSVSKTNSIYVKYSSKTAKLTAPTVTVPPNTYYNYVVTLTDANGKGIAKQKVTVKVNGKTYSKTTTSAGRVSVAVKFSSLKNYKATASYGGSKIYKKVSSSGIIKVAKTATKITAPLVSQLPDVAKSYTVTLKTGDGKLLSKQQLKITVAGKTYSKTTNSKGQASVSLKFTSEKTYSVSVAYAGNGINKASKAAGKITVSKLKTQIDSYNKTLARDSPYYQVTLKDNSGNPIAGQAITFTVNGQDYTQSTDDAGKAFVDLSGQSGDFDIVVKYAGNSKYKSVSKTNGVSISNRTNVIFIDSGLPNGEIQDILDAAAAGSNIEVLGDSYVGIALTINKALNIYSSNKAVLNAKEDNPVLTISAGNVNVSNFVLVGNSGTSILLNNANNVFIFNNSITNALDESKMDDYAAAILNMPGNGIHISNSSNVVISENEIRLFESGVYAEHSSSLFVDNNTLAENNYGITYGFGVANSQITDNRIVDCVGLYIMTVPEGPSGYGIFLNNSAVNVTINKNYIAYNHLGISIDANHSTGIVITQNTISDNVLEGIRFNAGYDLAENAVEPLVTDNAIYRNARGPSMMILGELSANPFGIYGGGLYNDSQKLRLDANWYGTNDLRTWDNDTQVVGYGTMCPRIKTTSIVFNEIVCIGNWTYAITLYKNGEVASNLANFTLYATLNRGTDKAVEVIFDVINGVGVFSFDADDFKEANNVIEISIGSLIVSTSRIFTPAFVYEVP